MVFTEAVFASVLDLSLTRKGLVIEVIINLGPLCCGLAAIAGVVSHPCLLYKVTLGTEDDALVCQNFYRLLRVLCR